MNRTVKRAIPFSLLIHAVAVYVIMAPPLRTPSETEELAVEIFDKPHGTAGGGAGGSPSRRRGRPPSGLKNLMPQDSFRSGDMSGVVDSGSAESLDQVAFGGQGGYLAEATHYLQYLRLLEEVQGLLYFPPALARREFSGVINSRIVFDANSRCDWSRTRIKGANRYLVFYSLGVLKKLCALDTLTSLKLAAGQYIDLSFSFVITESFSSAAEQESTDRIIGNVLLFERTYQHSVAEYQLGPLRGIWLVPAVQLDIGWIIENWEKYMNHRDPLREFKEAG